MASKRKLSASDVPGLFEGKDRIRNTRYLHTMLTNPQTPRENLELVDQYRRQHPEQFLTDQEISSNPGLFARRNTNRQYRQPGRAYLPDGRSYNRYNGEGYDRYGSPMEGFHDGGEEFQYRQRDYGYGGRPLSRAKFNQFRQGMGMPPVSRKNDPSQVLRPAEVNKLMYGLKSDYARTRYMQKVISNPESNAQTVDNLMVFKAQHPQMFVDEDIANQMAAARQRDPQRRYQPRGQYQNRAYDRDTGNRPVRRDYDRESWSEAWMTKDEYDCLPDTKKSLFTRFFMSRDRNRNSKLALRILSDPQSSQEDASAVREIVNERPKLFFKNPKMGPHQIPQAPAVSEPKPAARPAARKPRTTKKQ